MGGLACALSVAKAGFQDIQVYEMASDLGFVGAGIQLAPNMARILDRLGVWKQIEEDSVVLNETSVRKGAGDVELTHLDLMYIKETYGYPHMVGHRATLAGSLYDGCKREPAVHFNFAHSLESIRFSPKPTLTMKPRNGEAFEREFDIVLACDGVKSKTRVAMLEELGVAAKVQDTGQAAYRIMLTREQMQHDAELIALLDGDKVTRWIGERRHIIAYPISRKQIYNLSTAQPDDNFAAAPDETYTTKGSKTAMLAVFHDFCDKVQRMLNLVPEGEVCEWKLRVHSPLPTWVRGRTALVGDACHPTLPHMAQGAAQAIEDAAVLGVLLGRLPDASSESINKVLRLYEQVRKQRAETLVEAAAASGRALHLGEGKAKEERDKMFAALSEGKKGPVPDKWADADVQRMVYGHDCMMEAEKAFQEDFAKL
jgi:salicylate hydroxylase